MPTAWVPGPLKSPQFRTLISARAIENTVYMVACDQVGANAMGESVVVDPMGVVVASAGKFVQNFRHIKTADRNFTPYRKFREDICFH